jgi:hypothetical protein
MRKLYNFFRYDLPQGTRNILYWAPLVWGLRNWDYTYLVRIMIHALKDMEDLHKKHGHFVDTPKTIKQLSIARAALERHDGYDDLQWLDITPNENDIMKMRIELNDKCPFGSMKALHTHEVVYKRQMRVIFAEQFVKYLERWWD